MTPYETGFYETLQALGQEHLDNLVIVGGWCPFLYAKHVWRRDAPEIMTMDVDFAVKKMSPDHFSGPVYRKLLAGNLIPRRMDMDDDNRIQFAYLSGTALIPVEFITAPHILPKGQRSQANPYVACDTVPEVAIALKIRPLQQEIIYRGQVFSIQIASPAAFIVVKSLLLEHRINTIKAPRDLASIAFVLRYAPDLRPILREVENLKKSTPVREAGRILYEFMGDESKKGYVMLREYFQA